MKKAFLGGLLALATALGAPAGALAQDYPSKTIKIISPSAPGGPTDVSARIIADRLAQPEGAWKPFDREGLLRSILFSKPHHFRFAQLL
mgnify:CR=1 FL=1